MFSEHHCLVLRYNSNWTTNRPESLHEMTHVKNRKRLILKCIFWVLCWKFKKWYYITIIPFYKRILWVKIGGIWKPSSFRVDGVYFPLLYLWAVLSNLIGVKSNAIFQGFWNVRKFVSVHVAVAEWREQFMFHLASLVQKNVTVAYRKKLIMQNVIVIQIYSLFELCHFHYCNIKELKHNTGKKKKDKKTQTPNVHYYWLWLVLHALMLILNLAFHLLHLFDFPNKYLLKTFVPMRFTLSFHL